MSKYEEAYNLIEDIDNTYIKQFEEALLTIKELVERAMPKKVIYNDNMCPKCMLLVTGAYDREYMNYCPRCGQALDWSDK